MAAVLKANPLGTDSRTQAMNLQLADLDQDGLENLLLAVNPEKIHRLRRSNSSGQSWQPLTISPENTCTAVAVSEADLDGDGELPASSAVRMV